MSKSYLPVIFAKLTFTEIQESLTKHFFHSPSCLPFFHFRVWLIFFATVLFCEMLQRTTRGSSFGMRKHCWEVSLVNRSQFCSKLPVAVLFNELKVSSTPLMRSSKMIVFLTAGVAIAYSEVSDVWSFPAKDRKAPKNKVFTIISVKNIFYSEAHIIWTFKKAKFHEMMRC